MSPAAKATGDSRKSNADPRRIRTIVARLEKTFGQLEPPRAEDPLDELILTVLSQHTSDLNAERAFADMRAVFTSWDEVVAAPTTRLADAIRSGGLANSKAPRIQAILEEVRARVGGFDLEVLREMSDDDAREWLTSLPGVGPKTAAVVMSFALGRDALPVDTHVHRTSLRLGLITAKTTAEKADRVLHDLVPEGLRTPLHVGLINLGRQTCKAPVPACPRCPLRDLCPSAESFIGSAKGSGPASK